MRLFIHGHTVRLLRVFRSEVSLGRPASSCAVRALVPRMMADQIAGKDVAGAASIAKLAYSRAARAFTVLGLRIDPDAHIWQPYTLGVGNETGNWQFDYMGQLGVARPGAQRARCHRRHASAGSVGF